ncbi:hypothetical protein IKI14_03955 [bacterium]|nr:hypothetical protein [bacterium]
MKKYAPTVEILLVLNESFGKLVNHHIILKLLKKYAPTVEILLVSNEFSGRLIDAQFSLNL